MISDQWQVSVRSEVRWSKHQVKSLDGTMISQRPKKNFHSSVSR